MEEKKKVIQIGQYSLGILCFVTSLLHLLHVFFPHDTLQLIVNSCAVLLLVSAIGVVRRFNQIAAIMLVGTGSYIMLRYAVSPVEMLHGMGQNVSLLVLFLVVPFIGVMISVGGYLTAVKEKVQLVERSGEAHPYRLSTLLTAGMGVILNLGSMAIVHRIAEESFSSYWKKKMGVVILRAFGFCMFWSPYFVNLALITALLDVSWLAIAWMGILLALIYLGICALFFQHISVKHDELHQQQREASSSIEEVNSKIRGLLIWSIGLLGISFLLDYLLPIRMLTIVSIVALFFPLVWAISIGILREYIQAIVDVVLHAFERLKNEIVIFISAGYFGIALSYTTMGAYFSEAILSLSLGSIYLASVWVIFFTMLLAIGGIHPVIVIIGVGSSLAPASFGISPEYMAGILLIAWTLATMVSPFSGSVLMVSGLIKESPWLLVRQNLAMTILLLFVLPLVLYFLFVVQLL